MALGVRLRPLGFWAVVLGDGDLGHRGVGEVFVWGAGVTGEELALNTRSVRYAHGVSKFIITKNDDKGLGINIQLIKIFV